MSDEIQTQPNEESKVLAFGDDAIVSQVRTLLTSIESLPDSIHTSRLHQFVYDTLIALLSLQASGEYNWPQAQFQPSRSVPPDPPNLTGSAEEVQTLGDLAQSVGAWEQTDGGYVGFPGWSALKEFTDKAIKRYGSVYGSLEVASEVVDNEGHSIDEVPSMEVLATRMQQAMVEAGIIFPDLTSEQTSVVRDSLGEFLKDPKINTNEPFLIADPNDQDHLLKVSFEGFNIKVESTQPLRKPDVPLTPVEVMSNPINALPIMPFPTMQELLTPKAPRMYVYKASYPQADNQETSIFAKPHLMRRSTDKIN